MMESQKKKKKHHTDSEVPDQTARMICAFADRRLRKEVSQDATDLILIVRDRWLKRQAY